MGAKAVWSSESSPSADELFGLYGIFGVCFLFPVFVLSVSVLISDCSTAFRSNALATAHESI